MISDLKRLLQKRRAWRLAKRLDIFLYDSRNNDAATHALYAVAYTCTVLGEGSVSVRMPRYIRRHKSVRWCVPQLHPAACDIADVVYNTHSTQPKKRGAMYRSYGHRAMYVSSSMWGKKQNKKDFLIFVCVCVPIHLTWPRSSFCLESI